MSPRSVESRIESYGKFLLNALMTSRDNPNEPRLVFFESIRIRVRAASSQTRPNVPRNAARRAIAPPDSRKRLTFVRHEGIQLGDRRRQTNQIKTEAAQQSNPVSLQ